MDDKLVSDLLKYFSSSNKKYPDEIYNLKGDLRSNVKSKFRQTAKPCWYDKVKLLHNDKEVLPQKRLSEILSVFHSNEVSGGHFGAEKTYLKIAERFYCKGKCN